MAIVSCIYCILPLLPKQILLMNLMTDIPEMTISTDRVDEGVLDRLRRLDIKFIRKFMVVFGLLSTVFDYITFGALMFILHSNSVDRFRTAWFTESVISASIIVLVVRTRKPMFKSRPRKYLLLSILSIVGFTIVMPFTPVAEVLGFKGLSYELLSLVGIIVLFYIITAEVLKRTFYRVIKF